MENQHRYTISLEDIALGYPGRTLFEGINVEFRRGELTALIGRNGTGKSTLLRTIMGLVAPLRGRVMIGEQALRGMSASEVAGLISFVSTDEIRISNLKVYDVVGLGRAPYTNWIGRLTPQDHQVVCQALESVGMSAFAHKGIDTLSDGERQRVMIARSLAQDTPIILLDEPTAFLDLPNKYEIGLLLHTLSREQGKTILFSTHDLTIAMELCDRLVLISGGRFLHGTPDEMIQNGFIDDLFSDTSIVYDRDRGVIRLATPKN